MLTMTPEGIFLAAATYLAEIWNCQEELCTGRVIDGRFSSHDPGFRVRVTSPAALRGLAGITDNPKLRVMFELVSDNLSDLINARQSSMTETITLPKDRTQAYASDEILAQIEHTLCPRSHLNNRNRS